MVTLACRPPGVPFLEPPILFFIVIGFAFAVRGTLTMPGLNLERVLDCRKCRYSLLGLDENANCPECGCTDPRDQIRVVRCRVPGGMRTLALIGFASALGAWAPSEWLELVCRWEGFTKDSSANYARLNNELSPSWAILVFFAASLSAKLTRRRTVARRLITVSITTLATLFGTLLWVDAVSPRRLEIDGSALAMMMFLIWFVFGGIWSLYEYESVTTEGARLRAATM
ncbi:MAG: hypothetical protein JSS51_07485 [Planctomycetes bacterium]|nr:hypothetical protein [Planctomycetota bacterium]